MQAESDSAEIARIEKERRRREEALLLLLLALAMMARRLGAAAVQSGHDAAGVIRDVIIGNPTLHMPGLAGALASALADTANAAASDVFQQAGVDASSGSTFTADDFRSEASQTAEAIAVALAALALRTVSNARQAGKATPQAAQALRDGFTRYGWTRRPPQSIDPTAKGSPGYAAVAYASTAILRAWAVGQWEAIRHPAVVAKLTALTHRTIVDGNETDICHERDGLTLKPSDPYWQTNFPMLHYGCRSLILARFKPAELSTSYPKIPPMPGFGRAPEWAFGFTFNKVA